MPCANPSVTDVRAMRRWKLTAVGSWAMAAALLLAAPGAVASQQATTTPASAASPRGHLFIIGGGPRPEAMMRRFVELAGGPGRARIVVLPMASGDTATGERQAAELRALGAEATSLRLTRADAEAAGAGQALAGITGVWISGGVQSRFMDVVAGTSVDSAIHARYREGAVIGGTSAGAAVMSSAMLTGDEQRPGGTRPIRGSGDDAWLTIDRDNVTVAPGLGLLTTAIVDQHFLRRKRHNRLLSLVLERPERLGVGIDEATALEVRPDGSWHVVGESVAVIYDAREGTASTTGVLGGAGLRLHVLPAGGSFDVATGAARLAPGAR